MKTYSKAPEEATARVAHLIKLFHPELEEAGLKVDLLSVTNDDEDSPALTSAGYPAYAVVRVVDSKGRTMGRGDAEIVIDEARYLEMTDAQKDALLDHELYHIALRRSKKKGQVKLDEHGRPKIGMRKHDYQFGWFREIAERHGAASIECKQASMLFLREKQTFFAFVDERAQIEEAPAASKKLSDATVRFVRTIKSGLKDGESVTITGGDGKGVKIDKAGVRPA